MTNGVKIDGARIKLGTQEYIVPALNFKSLRRLESKIQGLAAIQGTPTAEQMEAVIDLVQSALSRNYPEITVEQVAEMIDMRNMLDVIQAIMGQSGIDEVPAGEAKSSQ